MTIAAIVIIGTFAVMAGMFALIMFCAARVGGLADIEMEKWFEIQGEDEEVDSEWQEHSKS